MNSKTDEQSITNGESYKLNGWNYVSIKGTPKERGYAHGFLLAKEFKEIQRVLNFNVMEEFGYPWDYFVKQSITM